MKLTQREKTVLAKLAEGLTVKEVANVLFVQPSTIATHKKNLYRKFQARTLVQLGAMAVRRGILTSFLIAAMIINGISQDLEIHGTVTSTTLAGNGQRNVVADSAGKLKVDTSQSSALFELRDSSGDVRIRMDADKGLFEMLDDGETFYSIQVQSPPQVLKKGKTHSNVRTEDSTFIESIQTLILNNLPPGTIRQQFADCFDITDPLVLFVTVDNNDVPAALSGGTLNKPFEGSFFIRKVVVGDLYKVEFRINPMNPSEFFVNINGKNLVFVSIPPINSAPSVQPPANPDESSTGKTGFNTYSSFKDSDVALAANFGIRKDNMGNNVAGVNVIKEFNNGDEAEASLEADKLMCTVTDHDSGEIEVSYVFSVEPNLAEVELRQLDDKVNINGDKVKVQNTVDMSSTEVNKDKVVINVNGKELVLNDIGFQASDPANNANFYNDCFGISKFQGTGFVGIGFDAQNGKIIISGDLEVSGSSNVQGAKNFKIDHPLDPYNKFLIHTAIESPEPINVYRGTTITDEDGKAVVSLPDYFETINIDVTYHLTVIGSFAQAIVGQKVHNNSFVIRTSEPGVEVSWQLMGRRNDKKMQEQPYRSVVEKVGDEKGRLMYEPQRKSPYNLDLKKHWDQMQAEK